MINFRYMWLNEKREVSSGIDLSYPMCIWLMFPQAGNSEQIERRVLVKGCIGCEKCFFLSFLTCSYPGDADISNILPRLLILFQCCGNLWTSYCYLLKNMALTEVFPASNKSNDVLKLHFLGISNDLRKWSFHLLSHFLPIGHPCVRKAFVLCLVLLC